MVKERTGIHIDLSQTKKILYQTIDATMEIEFPRHFLVLAAVGSDLVN